MKTLKVNLEERKIFFSSDFHFLHKNISGEKRSTWKDGYRDFKDEWVMTEELIDIINKKVSEDDILIFAGDFLFKDHTKIPEFRNRLIVKEIHFVLGNHDDHIPKYRDCFTSLQDMLMVSVNGLPIVISHYPQASWIHAGKGSYHLYGHVHGNYENHGLSLDIGVDNYKKIFGNYGVFSMEEIRKIMNKKKIVIVDHHKEVR